MPDTSRFEELELSEYGNPPPPPPPPPSGGFEQPGYGPVSTAPPLASWIQRVGAYLLDYLLTLPFSIVGNLAAPKTATTTDVNGAFSTTQTGGSIAIVAVVSLLSLAVTFYNRWYLGGKGQSFGKRVVGLTLIGETTGQPIGTLKAFLRDLAHFVDSIICLIGYLFPLWDSKRQTIADKIMSTVVVARA
jgi:uncharacterized RDD family membrane protein YckC